MKNTLAVMALTMVCSSAAMAQSSVVVYGRLDLTAGKQTGSPDKGIQNGSGNRLGVRATEDLGGGLRAFFNLEHGFNGDTGAVTDTARFWNRRAYLGLENDSVRLEVGHSYTVAYTDAQIMSDPFAHTMVSSMLRVGTGGIGLVRYDSSIKLQGMVGGLTLGAEIAEATDSIAKTADRPLSFAVKYTAGKLYAGYGYDNPGGENDYWHYLALKYNFGPLTLTGGLGGGKTNADAKTRSYLVGAYIPVGTAEIRAAYGVLENRSADIKLIKKAAVGYFYPLSKRTMVYGNLANDSAAATSKFGYDVGLMHNF